MIGQMLCLKTRLLCLNARRCFSTPVATGALLRETMRRVPQPVVVVTCNAEGNMRGLTCSSFNSISLDPPIVSFAVKPPSATLDLLTRSPRFAIHILASNQIAHSQAFASPITQSNFDAFPHFLDDGESPLPILRGCLSVLVCDLELKTDIGDHQVWYGRVQKVIQDGIEKSAQGDYKKLLPLVYYESSYRSIGDELFIEAFENSTLSFADWTHRAHLRY